MNTVGKKNRINSIVADSWLTVLFLAWVLLMLWASESLGRASAWIPQLVLFFTLVCLLLQLARELWIAWMLSPGTPAVAPETPGDRGRIFAAIAWLALLLLLTWLLGVAPASALFCLAWMRWHAGENWSASVILSASLGLVLWLVFSVVLGSDLYQSVLWSLV